MGLRPDTGAGFGAWVLITFYIWHILLKVLSQKSRTPKTLIFLVGDFPRIGIFIKVTFTTPQSPDLGVSTRLQLPC